MKQIAGLLGIAAIAAGTATALPGDILSVRDGQNWAGCVYQPSYDPYPVQITIFNEDFVVNYPGLCVGRHETGKVGIPHDAVEIIDIGDHTCIDVMHVDYTVISDKLRVDYSYRNGKPAAYAYLRINPEGQTPPSCQPVDATS